MFYLNDKNKLTFKKKKKKILCGGLMVTSVAPSLLCTMWFMSDELLKCEGDILTGRV